jgi:hypothetical protein
MDTLQYRSSPCIYILPPCNLLCTSIHIFQGSCSFSVVFQLLRILRIQMIAGRLFHLQKVRNKYSMRSKRYCLIAKERTVSDVNQCSRFVSFYSNLNPDPRIRTPRLRIRIRIRVLFCSFLPVDFKMPTKNKILLSLFAS